MSRQFIGSPLRTPSLKNIYDNGKRLRLGQIAGKWCVRQNSIPFETKARLLFTTSSFFKNC